MIQVTELGYMGIGVKDLDAWKNFATNIVGFELADEGESDRCYLRMDYLHHRIVMHADGSDDLSYLGFRVAGADEFAQMQRQLSEAGIKFRVGSEDEAEERRVLEVLKLDDPDGNPVEIFHGPAYSIQQAVPSRPRDARAFQNRQRRTRPLHHARARRERRAAILCATRNARRRRVQVRRAANIASGWSSCIATTAITPSPSEFRRRSPAQPHHARSGQPRRCGHDLRPGPQNKIPVTITPGKHSNDHMYSFYFRTPSGWMFEYGWGARPATYQSEYFTGDVYGHQPEAGGFEIPREKK